MMIKIKDIESGFYDEKIIWSCMLMFNENYGHKPSVKRDPVKVWVEPSNIKSKWHRVVKKVKKNNKPGKQSLVVYNKTWTLNYWFFENKKDCIDYFNIKLLERANLLKERTNYDIANLKRKIQTYEE